jgi:hypothetical protein
MMYGHEKSDRAIVAGKRSLLVCRRSLRWPISQLFQLTELPAPSERCSL